MDSNTTLFLLFYRLFTLCPFELSSDDGYEGKSNSISHQKSMLEKNVKSRHMHNIHHFIDDRWSGTRWDRPSFTELMSLVKEGKVGAIITKDMSRLGRDYLQVGMYTDIVFPDNDVRFIAIRDNVDSENRSQSNDFTAIVNLFNEFHARDTAKKVLDARIRWTVQLIRSGIISKVDIRSSTRYNLFVFT